MKTNANDKIVFVINKLEIHFIDHSSHPIDIIWQMQDINYKLRSNSIALMYYLLQYESICNIKLFLD